MLHLNHEYDENKVSRKSHYAVKKKNKKRTSEKYLCILKKKKKGHLLVKSIKSISSNSVVCVTEAGYVIKVALCLYAMGGTIFYSSLSKYYICRAY